MLRKNSGAFFNNHRIRVSKKNDINSCLFGTGGKIKRETDLPYRKSGCAASRYGLCCVW